jgi:RecA-family ATPase
MNSAPEKVIVIEPRFKLTPFSELKLGTEGRYLVKGLIPRRGLTVAWGPPKSAKSFWMFDVAMHVALGWDYCGRRVQQGPVVYCAFEGAEGFKARAEAFRLRKLAEDHDLIDFHLVAAPSNLVADYGDLIAAIRVQLGASPVLVVLDTLNRSLAGSESDDKDMAAYVKAADAIREAFDCAVVIVHHCGIDGSRPRGHTCLTCSADAQLAVKRDAAGNVLVTVSAPSVTCNGPLRYA